MKKLIFTSLLVIIIYQRSFAAVLEAGHYSDPRSGLSCTLLSIENDWSSEDLSCGLTFNANLSDNDYGLPSVLVRHLEYDNGTFGARYAPIEGMSFGYGLLLSDLDTLYYQPAFRTNEQGGLRVYYDLDSCVLEGMGTYAHLYGVRLKDLNFMNMNFGIECLSDASQASAEAFARSAYGAYVEFPLSDELSLFGEAASTSNGGEGSLGGISFDYDLIFAFTKIDIAAATFNDKFIPAYFTTGYDINPVDFSSLESGGQRQGSIISFNSGILGVVNLDILNENYTDGGSSTSGSFLITPTDRVSITGFVKAFSFSDLRAIPGEDGNMTGGSIEYKTRNGLRISANYRKTPPILEKKQFDTAYIKIGCEF
jgi:hypothetical protein